MPVLPRFGAVGRPCWWVLNALGRYSIANTAGPRLPLTGRLAAQQRLLCSASFAKPVVKKLPLSSNTDLEDDIHSKTGPASLPEDDYEVESRLSADDSLWDPDNVESSASSLSSYMSDGVHVLNKKVQSSKAFTSRNVTGKADESSVPPEDSSEVSSSNKVAPFSSYPLSKEILRSLEGMGIETPFEIQEKTLPLTLNGRDVIGRAVTGSGKTLAFAIPIVHVLSKSPPSRQPRAMVILPTRELCNQVYTCIESLSKKIRCAPLYGGTSYHTQERALSRGVDVIVATPGRLMDHLVKRRNFNLSQIQFLVLDEADELLTPQFKVQIEDVLRDCPKSKQMMLFSATMPPDIKNVTREYMNDAAVVDLVTDRSLVPDKIVHQALRVHPGDKMRVVADLIASENPTRALLFMPSKVLTHSMAAQLGNLGFNAAALNSDMSQTSREAVFRNFRTGVTNILVATDVAARGLDVPDIELVIQFDAPPNGVDFYIHRSGRTGRKGKPGKTVLVYSDSDVNMKQFIRELRTQDIKLTQIRPPSSKNVTEIILKNAVKAADPTSVSKDAMNIARPHAQKLLDEFGVESLTAALVSISKVDSRLQLKESGYGGGTMRRRNRWIDEDSRGGGWAGRPSQRRHDRWTNEPSRRHRDQWGEEPPHPLEGWKGDRDWESSSRYSGGGRGGYSRRRGFGGGRSFFDEDRHDQSDSPRSREISWDRDLERSRGSRKRPWDKTGDSVSFDYGDSNYSDDDMGGFPKPM